MRFEELLSIVRDEPVFHTGLLLVGPVKPPYIRRQLSEWTRKGKLYQFRRGLYGLAPPYQKVKPHPFLVGNRIVSASYVSTQAALGYYGLIPEHVAAVTSVTTKRGGTWDTPLGQFTYRHIKRSFLYGYVYLELAGGQKAFVAQPEKALLDLVYLEPAGDSIAYLSELRLQNLDLLDLELLWELAIKAKKPKLQRAAKIICQLAKEEDEEYEIL